MMRDGKPVRDLMRVTCDILPDGRHVFSGGARGWDSCVSEDAFVVMGRTGDQTNFTHGPSVTGEVPSSYARSGAETVIWIWPCLVADICGP